jgi:molybdenum-dependent DNA-binding transcriptional regulator ModE
MQAMEQCIDTTAAFWGGLDGITTGDALLVDWEWYFESAFPLIKAFLRPTEQISESYSCQQPSPCGCSHEVREFYDRLVAVCICEDGDCERLPVERTDLVVYRLDVERLGNVIRQSLGLARVAGNGYFDPGLWEIGTYGPLAAPVFFSGASDTRVMRELQKLWSSRQGPMILVTPTGAAWTPELELVAERGPILHIPLCFVVDLQAIEAERSEHELFKASGLIVPMLARFEAKLGMDQKGETLVKIHREIGEIRKDFGELRTAKARLEKMLADGMFAFTRKVDAGAFKVLCTILAEGDVAKASRSLGMPYMTLSNVVRSWNKRSEAYRAMADLVKWRKNVGKTETVPLNEQVLLEKTKSQDQPELLSEVLDGLLSMTEGNWESLSKELAEMLERERG